MTNSRTLIYRTITLGIAGMAALAGVNATSAEETDVAFRYEFLSASPEKDAGPAHRDLTFGKQVEFPTGPKDSMAEGIKVSPSLQGRAYFEDQAGGESSILHRLVNSEWTFEFWIKLEEFGERSQMLFCVQPVGDSYSDLNIRIQPEKETEGLGSIVLTDATGIVRAKSPALEWKNDVWYYIAITASPIDPDTQYTFYRGDKSIDNLTEVYTGLGKPLSPLKKDTPRVIQFANFWGNFGKDALRGVMGNIQLTWKKKEQQEIELAYHQAP